MQFATSQFCLHPLRECSRDEAGLSSRRRAILQHWTLTCCLLTSGSGGAFSSCESQNGHPSQGADPCGDAPQEYRILANGPTAGGHQHPGCRGGPNHYHPHTIPPRQTGAALRTLGHSHGPKQVVDGPSRVNSSRQGNGSSSSFLASAERFWRVSTRPQQIGTDVFDDRVSSCW